MPSMKRRCLIAASAAAFLPVSTTTVHAQSPITFKPISPKAAGAMHSNRLFDVRQRLGPNSALQPSGLIILIDYLVSLKLLSNEDDKTLRDLVALLARELPLTQLVSEIERLYAQVADKVGDVALALLDIVRSTVKYITEVLSKLDPAQIANVIASDFAGGMNGAATASRLGGGRTGAIIGAVIGAASASINAATTASR